MMLSHGGAFHITGPLWYPSVAGGIDTKGPVMQSFINFFVVSLNQLLKTNAAARAMVLLYHSI